MKKHYWGFILFFLLFIPSIALYIIHYVIFRDAKYILMDFLAQLAFLPIFYFFSSIIIDNILVRREKEKRTKNINMLIGVFFSDFGNEFIAQCSKYDLNFEEYSKFFSISANWKDGDYIKATKSIKNYAFKLDMHRADIQEFKNFLLQKRHCLITVLESGNLIEHDTFTDLLLAIFHLCEEFKYRTELESLTSYDYEHLAIDTIRAYSLIGHEWLNYSHHLKSEYPHLYSLSVSFNPFKKMDLVV